MTEKLTEYVIEFATRVVAFIDGIEKVADARKIRGALATLQSEASEDSESVTLGAWSMAVSEIEAGIGAAEEIIGSVSPEERAALNEQCVAVEAFLKVGAIDDPEDLKTAEEAVKSFRDASVTVLEPQGKARARVSA